MDAARRQLIVNDLIQNIQRRGWAEMSRELALEVFPSALEINQFAHKHLCKLTTNASGAQVFTKLPKDEA